MPIPWIPRAPSERPFESYFGTTESPDLNLLQPSAKVAPTPTTPLPETASAPQPSGVRWMGAQVETPQEPTVLYSRTPLDTKQVVNEVVTPPVAAVEEKKEKLPFWQRALQVFNAPFEWVQQNIINPALSVGLSVFVPDLQRNPGEDYFDWKRREWAAWKAPGFNVNVPWSEKDWRIDVKGVAELLPWFLIPGAGQVGGGIVKGAAAFGKLAPVVRAVGQAIRYSPWGLVEKGTGAVVGKALNKLGSASDQMGRAVSERVFGKIEAKEVEPVVKKFTDFFTKDVGPSLENKIATRDAQRKIVRAKIAQIETNYANGKISIDEYGQLLSAARKGEMDMPVVQVAGKFEPGEIRALKEMAASKLSGYDSARAMDALDGLLLGFPGRPLGTIPFESELELLEKAFGREFATAVRAFNKLPRSTADKILDAANAPRAVLSAFDLSATLRQGAFLNLLAPSKMPRSFITQIKAFMSEKLALEADDAIRSKPLFDEFVKLDGYIAPMQSGQALSRYEESFMSHVAERVPGVRRSERGFVAYLNEMRMAVYESIAPVIRASGGKESDLKAVIQFINAASGRGNIPASLEKFAPTLNALLFSPRLQLSRLQVLQMAFSKNPYVRKEAAKAITRFVGAGTALLTFLNATGFAKVEIDPRSADFGKIKIGDTRYDIWTGYVQYARFVAQILTGETKTSYGNLAKEDRDKVAFRFLQSKSSPAFGLMVDLLKGENYMGEPLFDDTTGFLQTAKNRLVPIFLQDVIAAAEQNGANGAFMALPSALGVGVLTYTNDLARIKDKLARQNGAESWEKLDPATQRTIEKTSPELIRAIKLFEYQSMGTQWGDYRLAGNAVEDTFEENVNKAVEQFKETGDGYTFREKINNAFIARKGGYTARSKDERFKEITDILDNADTPEELAQLGPEQLAIKAYNDALYSDDMTDEFGDYRFDEAEIRKAQLKSTLGEDLYNYVEMYQGLKYEDLPYEFKLLQKAKTALKPYWDLTRDADNYFGKEDRPVKERWIARRRKIMRKFNREIAYYYDLFYKKQEV